LSRTIDAPASRAAAEIAGASSDVIATTRVAGEIARTRRVARIPSKTGM
jgi:hypothetical protein